MSDNKSVLSLSLDRENAVCLECRTGRSAYLLSTFGVFLCQKCADATKTQFPELVLKSIALDLFSADETAIAQLGGNKAFLEAVGSGKDLTAKFSGKAAENYRKRLLALLEGGETAPESISLSGKVSVTIAGVFSWFGEMLTPLVEEVNERVTNSTVGQKLGELISSGFEAYDEKITRHIVSDSGFLHPIKKGLDSISGAFSSRTEPIPARSEPVHTEERLRGEEIEDVEL